MGLTYHEVRELLRARTEGASVERLLTIGRQRLFLHPRDQRRLAAEFALPMDSLRLADEFGGYADRFLGDVVDVRRLEALDVSDYEGASILHDQNVAVDAALDGQFDVVVDAGSLEHIFDVPVALSNLMRMTRLGGRLIISVPANNLCGHGFYQFSPELFFRSLNERSGFVLHHVLLIRARFPGVELAPARAALAVRDPDEVGERIGLVSRRPAMLIAHATKLQHVGDPFATPPQQSDYQRQWSSGRSAHLDRGRASALPPFVRHRLRGYRQIARFSSANRRFYRKE